MYQDAVTHFSVMKGNVTLYMSYLFSFFLDPFVVFFRGVFFSFRNSRNSSQSGFKSQDPGDEPGELPEGLSTCHVEWRRRGRSQLASREWSGKHTKPTEKTDPHGYIYIYTPKMTPYFES